MFIRLAFLSILFFSSDLFAYTPSLCIDTIKTDHSRIKIYGIANEEINLLPGENYFVLLKNNRSCLECFKLLNQYIKSIKPELHAQFILISLVDSSTLARKRNYCEDRKTLPDFDQYAFQFKHSQQRTFFDIAITNYTPEVVLITKGNIYHVGYREIFDHISMLVSDNFKKEITNLLK